MPSNTSSTCFCSSNCILSTTGFDVQAIDFSVHSELAEPLVLLLASLLYHSKRLFNLSNSLDFNLLSSFIQLLLYLLSLPSFQSFSQLGLNQLICYILDCYYPEPSTHDNSIKQVNQRYQQILVKQLFMKKSMILQNMSIFTCYKFI